MPLALLVAFVVVPVVEIYLIVKVGELIGVVPTVVLLLLDAALGTWLVRREGRRAWRALRTALDERRMPSREVADGALVLVGGALLITPGFLTDVLGALCLWPPTRALLRRLLAAQLRTRLFGR